MSLLKIENVRNDYHFIAELVGEPTFLDDEFTRNNPEEGEDATFKVMSLVWTYRQLYPIAREDVDKTIKFRLSEGQRESVLEVAAPRMDPRSVVGKLTEQCSAAGLPAPDSEDMQGKVVVITRFNETLKNGNTRLHNFVIANLGDRDNPDLDRGKEIADKANSATKEAPASY